MSKELDLKVSRKMQKMIRKAAAVVEREMGQSMGVALIVFPWAEPGKEDEIHHFQYGSNAPRDFMCHAMKSVVDGWKKGHEDIPFHEKN